jgi:hypothetical protein
VQFVVTYSGVNLDKKGYEIAHEASLKTSDEYTGSHGSEEYNAAIAHVCDLIRASYSLFLNGSFAPSLFLSITVFEEIAKTKSEIDRVSDID